MRAGHGVRGERARRTAPRTALGLAAGLALAGTLACGAMDMAPEGGRVMLHPGGDVLAGGEEVVITDSVPGDAMAAGRTIAFDGYLGGSYVGAGADQVVSGRVDGSVRAAGADVRVEASVGRNVTLAGADVELASASRVERNAYLAGSTIRIAGEVAGHAYVGGNEVEVDGVIGGDLRVEAARLTIGPGARIAGDVRYRTEPGGAAIDPGATIEGQIQELPPREEPEEGSGVGWYALRLLGFLAAGLLLVAAFPRAAGTLAGTMRARPGASIGFGLVALIAAPIAIGIVAVTLIGIPAALILAGLYAAFLYLAPVVPAVWLGDELLRRERVGRPRGTQVKRFLAGGLVLAFAMLLPWVGWPVRALAVCLGLGALVLALTRGRPEEAAPAPL
ncbi:MAG TPA: polymer-forming cytoskeletal protein [Longimicrobiales bacterium]|nr:polymer-forming cytoskeletal protein [Longimicrobiales bacterium]